MRSGTALTQLVEFSGGLPDGDVSWELLDGRGQQVAQGTVTPTAGALSTVIALSADQNQLTDATLLYEPRELQWSYTVSGLQTGGRFRYRIEAFLPFGVSEDGVRTKLGLESEELEDAAIDLLSAYGWLQDQVTAAKLALVTGLKALAACNAIEARAATLALPALQVKLAQKESSGTDQFQRADIDWSRIQVQLDQYMAQGIAAVDPLVDPTTNFGSLLVTVKRDDPVTGSAA